MDSDTARGKARWQAIEQAAREVVKEYLLSFLTPGITVMQLSERCVKASRESSNGDSPFAENDAILIANEAENKLREMYEGLP